MQALMPAPAPEEPLARSPKLGAAGRPWTASLG